MIRPNPSAFDFDKYGQYPEQAQNDPRGFKLIAWWTPRERRMRSVFFNKEEERKWRAEPTVANLQQQATNKDPPVPAQSTPTAVGENEAVVLSYRDLSREHLPELLALREEVYTHLQEVFGFSLEESRQAQLFFHEYGSMVPAHLHVAVGGIHRWPHASIANSLGSVMLEEVIAALSMGSPMTALRSFDERPFAIFEGEGKMEDPGWRRWLEEHSTAIEGPFEAAEQGPAICRVLLALRQGQWSTVPFYALDGGGGFVYV